ncbi:MAG: hypothetical protein AAFZ38_00130 [Myxococcota bacterium]
MLKDHPIDPVLLSRDLQRSHRFYEQGLNLPLIVAREHMLVYQVGGMGRTEGGVADVGFAWAAWVVDPDGNTLGILQLKD